MAKETNKPGFKLLSGIVGNTKHYEESGAVVTMITTMSGGLVAVFGVPAARKGGPAKGQAVDMAVIETLDTEGGVAARNYGGQWRPAKGLVDLDKLEAATDAPAAAARPAFVKPADYQRKTASIVADEAAEAPAATPEPAPAA